MKIERLLVLLPCHSLEDLEIERDAAEAEQILSAWSVLYHPALVHAARAAPGWLSANLASREVSECLMILPECCEPLLPEEWLADAEAAGASVLRKLSDRPSLIAAALERLDYPPPAIDPELVADFLALGYCHFVVELLTRKLRYMSNLDETAFRTALLAAAEAAVAGEVETARRHLQGAFDRLHDAREYFYPTEVHLLDLTLVASTTLGESLRKDLQTVLPRNVMLSGEVLEEMVAREPKTWAVLKESLEKNNVAMLGGEYVELPLPLLPPEAIAENLTRGLAVYEKHLGRRPKVFARRPFGLTPALPQILRSLGFSAVAHFTLDDGQFPAANQSRVQWEGFEGETIEALARIPVDVGKADFFLALPRRLGDVMELDHTPSQVFAHWPGRVSPWYEDLRRIASYSSVLGVFRTVDDYFENTQLAGQRVQYRVDQYRSPYLTQDAAGSADAISRWVRYYRRRSMVDAATTLNTMSALLSKGKKEHVLPLENILPDCNSSNDPLDRQLQEALDAAVASFAESLRGKPTPSEKYSTADKGYLLVNPLSFSQRQGLLLPELTETPKLSEAVLAASEKAAVIDLPSLGFVWIGANADRAASEQAAVKDAPPLAEEHLLRNEYFEIKFDPITGAIRAVSDYRSRHPRLAQQIALRIPQGDINSMSDGNYSIMAADEFQVKSSGPLIGEMACRGRLMDREGQCVAGFLQTTRVGRGSRIIEIEIEIDPHRLPEGRPWNSYYASRFAWHDEGCDLFRSVNLSNQSTELVPLESPLFIDIRSGKLRTTILSAGLPYHRRIGPRRLDSLLMVPGETARKFRIGVAIDVPNPTTAALAFIGPQVKAFGSIKPPAVSGWLFHLDHRNVIAAGWLPLTSREGWGGIQEPCEGEGRTPCGFRVRLLETEGRPAQLKLRCLRPVAAARKLETGDAPPAELIVEGDTIHIPMSPHQRIDVEAMFQS